MLFHSTSKFRLFLFFYIYPRRTSFASVIVTLFVLEHLNHLPLYYHFLRRLLLVTHVNDYGTNTLSRPGLSPRIIHNS